jgi:hypothetical protein
MGGLFSPPIQYQYFNEAAPSGRSQLELPQPVVGLVGAAAMTFVGIAMCKRMLVSRKRKSRRRRALTQDQRRLLKTVIARGEEKGWDFSFDEDFIFKLLPALKEITR